MCVFGDLFTRRSLGEGWGDLFISRLFIFYRKTTMVLDKKIANTSSTALLSSSAYKK